MAQKKMKDIFTNEMGQILFPGQPTVIESKKISPGTDITMKNTRPQIALTPYGAAQMSPNQNYSFAGNTVVELPMAQMGAQAGGDDQQAQIMQIIQMYAQIKGVDPNQLIQEIQALPQEEQQKSFELMASEVQNAMAQQQQQQAAQQEQPGAMPMARKGGMMDAYPQAQNLEWFYRTAKNGGLLKAQDLGNINLYDRVLSDRKNFMSGPEAAWKADPALVNEDGSLNMCLDCTNVDYSNQQDVIDASRLINEGISKVPEYSLNDLQIALKKFDLPMPVYNSAKTRENIINQDPSLKKQRAGGGLSIHQLRGVVDSMVKDAVQRYMTGGEAFPQANKYPEEWAGYSGTMYAQGGEAFPQAQTYLPYDRPGETRPNFMFAQGGSKDEFGGQPDLDTIYRMMRSGGLAVNAKKKRGEELSSEEFQQYLSGGSLKEFQGTNQSTTGPTAGNTMTGFSPMNFPSSSFSNLYGNRSNVLIDGKTADQAVDAFGKRLNTITDQGKQDMFKYQGLTEDEKRIAQIRERANESQPTGLKSWSTVGDLRNAIQSSTESKEDKKQGTAKYKTYPGIHPANYLAAMNTAMGGKGSLLGLIGNVASLVGDFASPPMAGGIYGTTKAGAEQVDPNDLTRQERKTLRRELRMLNKPTRPQTQTTTDSQATADSGPTPSQSVTDGNVNDYLDAAWKRVNRYTDLEKQGVNLDDNYSFDQDDYNWKDNIDFENAQDRTSAGKAGPSSLLMHRAIIDEGLPDYWDRDDLENDKKFTNAYDILNNSDKYSAQQVADAEALLEKGFSDSKVDWSTDDWMYSSMRHNVSGGPQSTSGPRDIQPLKFDTDQWKDRYKKGGRKKVLPKAQFALDPSTANLVTNASSPFGGFMASNSGGYNATVPATGGFSQPNSLVQDSPPPAEGIFSGMDAKGNAVSMNPNMADAYNQGFRPEGPTLMSNRDLRRQNREERREYKKSDEYKDARKQQRKDFWEDPNAHFDHAKAARMVGATQGIADFFKVGNQEEMEDQLKKMGVNTSATMAVKQGSDRGDFMANTGRFRPNEYVEAQDSGRSMTDKTSFYNTFNQMYNAKMGGKILDFFEDGGVYDLDEDTIRLIMEAGGSVEFI